MVYNLQPLITILEGILDPHQSRWIVDENNPQLQSLLDKAIYLQQLLDKFPLMTKLDSQIREVVHQAEDIIESHMVDQILSGSNCVIFTLCTPDLQQVTRELDSVVEQAENLVEMEDTKMLRELDSAMEQVKLVEMEDKKNLVGIDGDLRQLKDRLTCLEKKREIVPIVGMGGVGKTSLARKLYDDPLIVGHFAYRAWATVSQDYNMRQILLSLLSCLIKREEFDQHKDKGMHELKDILYKSLYGRKYLIVLDDIWSTKFWDEMRMYFPDNNNGSRIVITTRESNVANYADSLSSHHQVQLLSKSESWNLLHQLVFGEEDCPLVLQAIGQKIAKGCSGLPLAISVIGGLLSKMERSKDVWKKIGDNVIAAIGESDERCYSILSLSYNHLPNHLKPCFLYMGAFPEDFEIKGSKLARLWVVEGFVKSNGERSLEEEAKDWIKSLVERNLFMVREYKKNGKPKSYSMHDMLRDLCIRKCDEDKFLYVNGATESVPLTRSIIRIGSKMGEFPYGAISTSRLLRVLDFLNIKFNKFPTEIFEFVNLRFLGVNCDSYIPRGISRLWNLKTLIAPFCMLDVLSELWQLSELRYLKVYGIMLKDEEMNHSVLKKLRMISIAYVTEETTNLDGFLKSIPNIKKLEINYSNRYTSMVIDLSHLHKLETLRCDYLRCIFPGADGLHCHFKVILPCNIKKLYLSNCDINLEVLKSLSSELHKLEVLTIGGCDFKSKKETCEEEWEVADGDVFCSLQFLSLQHLDLVRWIADETNFPRLCHLRIRDCRKLEEIPSGIGEIPTLQLIELVDCSKSAVASAERIVEEQSENGNDDLKLRVTER